MSTCAQEGVTCGSGFRAKAGSTKCTTCANDGRECCKRRNVRMNVNSEELESGNKCKRRQGERRGKGCKKKSTGSGKKGRRDRNSRRLDDESQDGGFDTAVSVCGTAVGTLMMIAFTLVWVDEITIGEYGIVLSWRSHQIILWWNANFCDSLYVFVSKTAWFWKVHSDSLILLSHPLDERSLCVSELMYYTCTWIQPQRKIKMITISGFVFKKSIQWFH